MSKSNQSLTTSNTAMAPMKKKSVIKKTFFCIAAITAIIFLAYLINPLDPIIPDIIVGLGYIDDLLVACIPVLSSLFAVGIHFVEQSRNYAAQIQ